jgi:hypothetical protein
MLPRRRPIRKIANRTLPASGIFSAEKRIQPTVNLHGRAATSHTPSALCDWRAHIRVRVGGQPSETRSIRAPRGHPSCANPCDPDPRLVAEDWLPAVRARPAAKRAPPERRLNIRKRRNDVNDACSGPRILNFRPCYAAPSTMPTPLLKYAQYSTLISH